MPSDGGKVWAARLIGSQNSRTRTITVYAPAPFGGWGMGDGCQASEIRGASLHPPSPIPYPLLPHVGVVAGEPVGACWGEGIDHVAVFENFHTVRHVGRDHQAFPRTEFQLFAVDLEHEGAAHDIGYLLVDVMVLRHHSAFLQVQAGNS